MWPHTLRTQVRRGAVVSVLVCGSSRGMWRLTVATVGLAPDEGGFGALPRCLHLQLVQLAAVEMAECCLYRQDRIQVVAGPLHTAAVQVCGSLHCDELLLG